MVKLIHTLALAVERAHQAGVIHRDLKPENVMINTHREPVIMDFGLARRQGSGDTKLTQAGPLLGTPAYMSPEQVSGKVEAMGPGCDVYSLGVILYQMLTGKVPFEGDILAVLSAIANDSPPRPSQLRPEIDSTLEAIVLKAMEKQPERRYTSMGEFAGPLSDYQSQAGRAPQEFADELLRSAPGPARPTSPSSPAMPPMATAPAGSANRPTRAVLIAGAVVSLLVLLAVIFGVVFSAKTPLGTVTVEAQDGEDIQVAVSSEGKQIHVIDKQRDWTLKPAEGSYDLEMKSGDRRFQLDSQSVTVRRDEEIKVRVTLQPNPAAETDDAPASKEPSSPAKSTIRVRPPQEAKMVAAPDQPTEFQFDEIALADAIDKLATKHNLVIELDTNTLAYYALDGKVSVTARVKGISLRSGLNRILQPFDLTGLIEENFLLVTTEDVVNEKLEWRTYDIQSLVAANFDPKTLAEALKKIGGGVWKAADQSGGFIANLGNRMVVLQTQPMQEEILAILQGLQLQASGQAQPLPSEHVQRILAALEAPAEFAFTEVPLTEIVDVLSGRYKINVDLDRWDFDDAGLSGDETITGNFKDVSLRAALSLLFDELRLTTVIEDEVLLITTREAAAEKLEWKIYDVGEADPQALADVIRESGGSKWQTSESEGGTIAVLPHCLVITQTQQAHREIASLLQDLLQ